MKRLIVFNGAPEEAPEGFYSIGINADGDTVYETLGDVPSDARMATAVDIVGLPSWDARKKSIESERDKVISSGVEMEGNTYDSTPESSQKISGVIALAGGNTAFKTNWITADNQIIELTLAKLKKLGLAIMTLTTQEYMKAREAKDAIADDIISQFNQ